MQKGSYKGRRVNFERYAASRFNPYIFCGSVNSQMGCGATALALLTGTPPATIALKNGKVHYPDKFMVRFLRQKQFVVLELTLCNLTLAQSELSSENVLLVSQLFAKNLATWGVIFQGMFYHGFRSYTLDSLSLLSKPLLSAYAVVHPRWRLPSPASEKPAPKPVMKGKAFTLAALAGVMRSAPARPETTNGK